VKSRERVQLAINHIQPDKIPVDVGATTVTGIHAQTYYKLKKSLGLDRGIAKVFDPFQMLVEVKEEVKRMLGVDVQGIRLPYTVFGYKNENWKPFKMPDGTEVLVSGHLKYRVLANGDIVQYPQGDMNAPPSGKMSKDGFYFDVVVRQEPFDENSMDPKQWVEETYSLCSDENLRYLEDVSVYYYENTDYSLIAELNPAGFAGVVALIAPHVKKPKGIRDPEEFWLSYISRKSFIQDVFHYQYELQMQNLSMYREALGDRIDVIIMSMTDFGAQNGPLISPQLYRELFKPLHKNMNDWVHQNTNWKTFFHTCGDITLFLDDFAEAGVDILNPVQISAKNMDPRFLKENYGNTFTFWGGGIDTQKTLPFGTPEMVKKEVEDNMSIFGEGGGFVFFPEHNIQANIPIENLKIMFETVRNKRG